MWRGCKLCLSGDLEAIVRILTLSMDREYTETPSRHIKNAKSPQRIDIELDGEEEGGVVH